MADASERRPAGARDLAACADDLAQRVPEPLRGLAHVAYDLRWSWDDEALAVLAAIDPERWEASHHNPIRLLREAPYARLVAAAEDPELGPRIAALAKRAAVPPLPVPADPVAYVCAEFAIHHSLRGYGGGLGVLAGDILKESADLGLPVVGVGLLYRQGAAHQRTDATGWQHDWWSTIDPAILPMARVTGADGEPVLVSVPIGARDVVAQIWRMDVGSVPLFLLDSDRPENDPAARWTTQRLYDGDEAIRLAQYALLGSGGIRALRAMGLDPRLVHLNEGHAALAALELVRAQRETGVTVDDALAAARERTIFTTHTPVPAGNDTYHHGLVEAQVGRLADEAGLGPDRLVRLGRTRPDDEHEPLGVTQLALRTSRAANGVAERHGEVSREMWHGLWPDLPVEDVPIGHVTNGVHLPTWLGGPMRALLDRHLGEGWTARADDPATWAPVDGIPATELWAARCAQRATLVTFARERGAWNRLHRGDERVIPPEQDLDPDVLTIGFARRIATYKRLGLLVSDVDRALRIIGGERPVQVLISGKAHPRDEHAKHTLQALFSARADPRAAGRVTFLDDYDTEIGALLTQGCDVWLNLPRPPLEASGTSGMKSAANGGLNLSVLDGWWWEAYDGTNGWALDGTVDHGDLGARDWHDAQAMLDLLEQDVVPRFHDRDADGIPQRWIEMMRASLRTNGPRFSATRMVREYATRLWGLGA